jgi:hypothetical protein
VRPDRFASQRPHRSNGEADAAKMQGLQLTAAILLVLLVVQPSASLQAAFAQASLPVFIVAFTILRP